MIRCIDSVRFKQHNLFSLNCFIFALFYFENHSITKLIPNLFDLMPFHMLITSAKQIELLRSMRMKDLINQIENECIAGS